MRRKHQQYSVAVMTRDDDVRLFIATSIESPCCTVLYPSCDEELIHLHLFAPIDLIIIAHTEPLHLDDMLYRQVEVLRAMKIDIFVLMGHHSVHHTLRLLTEGVRQCMTFPITSARLSMKVYGHLAQKVPFRGIVS